MTKIIILLSCLFFVDQSFGADGAWWTDNNPYPDDKKWYEYLPTDAECRKHCCCCCPTHKCGQECSECCFCFAPLKTSAHEMTATDNERLYTDDDNNDEQNSCNCSIQ